MKILFVFLLAVSLSVTKSLAMEASTIKTRCWEIIEDSSHVRFFFMITECRYNLKQDCDGRLFAVKVHGANVPQRKILTRTSNPGSGISVIDLGVEEALVRLKIGMNELRCGDSVFIDAENGITYYDRSKNTVYSYELGTMPVPIMQG